jgi:hypothetical protein
MGSHRLPARAVPARHTWRASICTPNAKLLEKLVAI